jgi:SAM-dependent methyltransferase
MVLAGKFKRVDGYDISPGHLERARQRAQETGIRNVALHECSSNMLASLEKCDFFYSRIVFQHKPPPVIVELIRTAVLGDGLRFLASSHGFNLQLPLRIQQPATDYS